MSPEDRTRRRDDLAKRLTETRIEGRKRCWVVGCIEPPGNVSSDSLGRFCRRHLEHHRRHGDALKASYKAIQIRPCRTAARAWLKRYGEHLHVKAAVKRIEALMLTSGRTIAPNRLRGMSPKAKAQAVWARLREREVSAYEVLASILAVVICHEGDHQKATREYRQVQVAKVINRMAGGTVKRWPTHHTDPTLPKVKVLRWFPASEGLVLRKLGETAEVAAEFLVHDHIEELAAFAKSRVAR